MRTFLRFAGLNAAAILLAHPCPLLAQGPATAGFVTSMRGEWFMSSHPLHPPQPLAVSQVLTAGDSVWAGPSRNASHSLNIALYGNARRKQVNCSVPDECDRKHVVEPGTANRPSLRERLEAAWGPFRKSPEVFRPHITRGTPPAEAVLIRGRAGLDLAPALRTQLPGGLRLEAAPVDSAGVPGRWQPLSVTWAPGSPALVRDSLPAGLYALRVAGEGRANAWVLVVDETAQGAAEAAAAFAELSAPLQEWSDGAGYADARSVLRAFLHHLAFSGHAVPVWAP